MIKHFIKKYTQHKYDNLYLDILKIGRLNINSGLSFTTLKEQLIKKGYDFSNDCIELAVKRWFLSNFTHEIGHDASRMEQEFETHLDCHFIMTGNSCLKLIEYET